MKGIFTTKQLERLGHDKQDRRLLTEMGGLMQIRRGWFATPGADPGEIRAVRVGGALSCVSALTDFWVPEHRGLHVRIPGNSRRAIDPLEGAVLHRLHRCAGTPGSRDDVVRALACAQQCVSAAEWVAIADSILHSGEISRYRLLQSLLWVAPEHCRELERLMARTDRRSESGSESILRYGLHSAGIHAVPQVWIESHRVDLLVGERLVLECDSRAHHTSLDAYERDRRRDQQLTAWGYQVVRFTYRQIIYELDEVLDLVKHFVRNRIHLNRSRDALLHPALPSAA